MVTLKQCYLLGWGLLLSSPLQAQVVQWRLVTPLSALPYHYTATALGNCGDTVVVAATWTDSASRDVNLLFQRSEDGGETWQICQTPFGDRHNDFRIHSLCVLDGRTVIAASDSGYLVSTHDAGAHWDTVILSRKSYPAEVHFSSGNEGMIVCRGDTTAYITTNGGATWRGQYLHMSGKGMSGLSLGNGRFRLFSYGYGTVYSTRDYWQHYDTTMPLSPQNDLTHVPVGARMEDTTNFIGYGTTWLGDPAVDHPFMARSKDAGRIWDTIAASSSGLHSTQCVSRSDRDTMLAVGDGAPAFLISLDHGATWMHDTLVSDADHRFFTGRTVLRAPSGKWIGIFKQLPYNAYPGEILIGTWQSATVNRFERIVYNTSLYPNPATTSLSVQSVDYGQPLLVYDILGHEVLRGKLDGAGHAQFEVSALPRGVYSVILKHNGIPLPIGKVAVVSR